MVSSDKGIASLFKSKGEAENRAIKLKLTSSFWAGWEMEAVEVSTED
jgi:hypothetical protein